MANGVEVTLVGNVTRDPELRFTKNDKPYARFSVAVNRRHGDQDNTSYYDVVAWDSLGENVAATLAKGMRVVIQGRLDQRHWETEDNQKRSAWDVTADAIGPDLRWATAKVDKVSRDGGAKAKPAGAQREREYDDSPF
jgi:single-strand DNA-binding protein